MPPSLIITHPLTLTPSLITYIPAALPSAFARGVPPASRASILSPQYLQRLAKAGVKCEPKDPTSPSHAAGGAQKAAAASPAKAAKGKGKEPAAPAAGQGVVAMDKLIFDPDGIPEAKVTTNQDTPYQY